MSTGMKVGLRIAHLRIESFFTLLSLQHTVVMAINPFHGQDCHVTTQAELGSLCEAAIIINYIRAIDALT